jgi:hypothetical protein
MRNGLLISTFWGLLLLWGYQYPYQWWLKYGQTDAAEEELTNNYLNKEKEPQLPAPFWGASLAGSEVATPPVAAKKTDSILSGADLSKPVLLPRYCHASV